MISGKLVGLVWALALLIAPDGVAQSLPDDPLQNWLTKLASPEPHVQRSAAYSLKTIGPDPQQSAAALIEALERVYPGVPVVGGMATGEPPIADTPEAPMSTMAPPEPAASPPLQSPGTATGFIPRGRRLWTASLAAALLVTSGGIGLLYLDDTSYQNADQALTLQNESLTGRNELLQGQLTSTQADLTATKAMLATAQAELQHPTLEVWNVPQQVQGATYFLAAGVPDTFTYHLKLTSTGPMRVSILSFQQFGDAIKCVENGIGNTNYCMHHSGTAQSWLDVTTVSSDFANSEGCAAYMLVITAGSPVTVTPNVSVTYNPASHLTGACA